MMMGRFQSVSRVVVLLSLLLISIVHAQEEKNVQHAAIRGAIRRTAARALQECDGDYTYCASSGECIQSWVTFCEPGGEPAAAASSSSESEDPEPVVSSSSESEDPEPVASSSSSEDVPAPTPVSSMDSPTFHPTVTDQPSDTFKPTYHPTVTDRPTRTHAPTTFLPTITPFPTHHPTVTDQPTFNPTVTDQPTRTHSPTFHPTVTDQPTTVVKPENCRLCDATDGFTNNSFRVSEWEYASCEEAAAYVYVSIDDYGYRGQCNFAKKAAYDAGCICEGYEPPAGGFKPADSNAMGDIP